MTKITVVNISLSLNFFLILYEHGEVNWEREAQKLQTGSNGKLEAWIALALPLHTTCMYRNITPCQINPCSYLTLSNRSSKAKGDG
jgi:hypothetical protein